MTLVTFLQLSPEFGGMRFGPFTGVEIRLGSDPELNDITLPETLGVSPQHVKVLQQGEETFIIAPVDRTSTVFIWRANSNKPKQITTPMAIRAGDGFSLVTPEGPRFYIQQEQPEKTRDQIGGSMAQRAMKRMPTSKGLLEEVQRRGLAKVMATRLGNTFQWGYRFVVSGQIFNPIYIVGGLMMLSSFLLAGGASCGAIWQNNAKNEFRTKLDTCKDELNTCGNGEEGERPSVAGLTAVILQDRTWKTTLQDDRQLMAAFATELDIAFSKTEQFKWAYRNDKTDVAKFYRKLNGMPPNLINTLAFVAAKPRKISDREWTVIEDSEQEPVCGRGPLGLTYRQAVRLGLENVQLDVVVTNSAALSQDIGKKREALARTAAFLPEEPAFEGTRIADAGGAEVQGGRECMHLEGVDDRNDLNAIAARFKVHFGGSASGLPDEGTSHWIANRLTKLATMDFIDDRSDLKFSSTSKTPLNNLAAQDVFQKQRDFVARYVAQNMAQAVATRCMSIMDKDNVDNPPDFFGAPPTIASCAMVEAFVKYGRL